jgi:uncharacterized protein
VTSSDIPKGLGRRAMLGLMTGAMMLPLLSWQAAAQSLNDARAQGLLGERPDGYVGAVQPTLPVWASTLMKSVNEQRKAKFAELAEANGTSIEAVQVVAGEKLIEKLPVGAWFMDADGRWVQK